MGKKKVRIRNKSLALTLKEGKLEGKDKLKLKKGKYGPMTNRYVPDK